MVKYDKAFVAERIQTKVNELRAKGVLNDGVVYLVMMNGGVWFAVHVFDCMENVNAPVYFVKGHSYQGSQQGVFEWDYFEVPDLAGRDVVVLDDICDSGNTSRAVLAKLQEYHPRSVRFFTLLCRSCTNTEGLVLDTCIVDDTKDFFYGCGLDSHDSFDRFHPYIGICE